MSDPVDPKADLFAGTEASGLVDDFALAARDAVLYDHRLGCWFGCEGGVWRRDEDGATARLFKATVEARTLERLKAGKDLDAVRRIANRDLSSSVLRRSLEYAQTAAPLAKNGRHWHADPFELATADGQIIDLRTGGMRPADPLDYVRQTTAVPCDPSMSCDRWRAFIREVMDDDADRVTFLHRWLGYCLTGDIGAQTFVLFTGNGSNGKSTLLELVSTILGGYAGVLPYQELTRQRDTRGASPEIAKLVGLRMVRCVEFPKGAALDVARLKSITGGDTMSTRGLFKDPFDFAPVFKLTLCANDLPRVPDTSHAYWRRAVAVPFDRRFPKDPAFKARLFAEAPGILAWLVVGCLDWQTHGLPVPAACVRAAAEWREQDDLIGQWISTEIIEDPDGRVPASDAYAVYLRWCDRAHVIDRERATATAFGKYLASRFQRGKAKTGWYYQIRVTGSGLPSPLGKDPHAPAYEEGFQNTPQTRQPVTADMDFSDPGETDPAFVFNSKDAFGKGKPS